MPSSYNPLVEILRNVATAVAPDASFSYGTKSAVAIAGTNQPGIQIHVLPFTEAADVAASNGGLVTVDVLMFFGQPRITDADSSGDQRTDEQAEVHQMESLSRTYVALLDEYDAIDVLPARREPSHGTLPAELYGVALAFRLQAAGLVDPCGGDVDLPTLPHRPGNSYALQSDLDAVEERVTALEEAGPGEGGGASEAYVDGAVATEATARASADSLLSDLLTAEVTARSTADTAATASITSEATTRAAADAAQSAALTAEVNARVAADAALTATVQNLIGLAPSALDTLAEIAARIIDDEATLAAISAALGGKVDKVTGYGLTKNDLTDALLAKLNGIAAGATANSTDAFLRDRANHTGVQDMATITGLVATLATLAGKADPSLVSARNLYKLPAPVTMSNVAATEVTLASFRIPGGTLGVGSSLSILGLTSMAGAGGNRTPAIRMGNTTTMASAPFVRQVVVTSGNLSYPILADLFIDTATTAVGYNLGALAPIGASGAVRPISGLDLTQDIWVYVTGTKAVSTDTIILSGLRAVAYL